MSHQVMSTQEKRMLRWMARMLFLGLYMALISRCMADIAPEVVERGKKATALVELEGGQGFGSAFCVDPAGFFVTNEHVATALGGGKRLTLVLSPGERDQKLLMAKVVRLDRDSDLALLQVEKVAGLTALELGEITGLAETQPVTAFGYPFGRDLAVNKSDYPSVTVSTGHITALRRSQGELEDIQLDAVLNHGNSGGPVINAKGQVIGIVVAGIPGAGINYAIPVSRLATLLSRAEIAFSPAVIPLGRQHEAQEFVIHVATFRKVSGDESVELILNAPHSRRRTFPAHSRDGHTFFVKAVPVPADTGPVMLLLTVKDAESELTCRIKDQSVTIGGKTISLSQIRQIQRDEKTTVTLVDGQSLTGELIGLEAVQAEVIGKATTLNLNRAGTITIDLADASLLTIEYRVVVRQSGKVIGEETGVLALSFPFHPGVRKTFLPDGELFVSSFRSTTIKRIDGKTGAFIDDFVTGNGIDGPHDLVFGPDNNLYVSGGNTNAVQRFNGKTGVFMGTFVSSNSGGLSGPQGITFGPDGNLYVCSVWTDQVKRYNGITGAFLNDFAGGNGLDRPHGLTFGPDGHLYVTSNQGNAVIRFNGKTGRYRDTFVPSGSGGLQNPYGLTFGPDNNLYVSSGDPGAIKRYNGKTGVFMGDFASGNGLNLPTLLTFRHVLR
jgi:streptogramin lyase